MRIKVVTSLSLSLLLSAVTVETGLAQSALNGGSDCVCSTALQSESAAVGLLIASNGAVAVNGVSGAPAGTQIFPGTTIETGENSSASFSVGPCQGVLSAKNKLTITKTGADLCFRVAEVSVSSSPALFAAAGVAVVGVGVAALGGGSNPASP